MKGKKKPIRFDVSKNDISFSFKMESDINKKMIEVSKQLQISRAETIRRGIDLMYSQLLQN